LDFLQEAVDLHRALAEGDRAAYLPALAMSVNTHAIVLAKAGRRVEALTASDEAVSLCRELTSSNRNAHLLHVIRGLRDAAWVRQFLVTDLETALLLVEDSINRSTELEDSDQEALASELRSARWMQVGVLEALGRVEEADSIRLLILPPDEDEDDRR
jgi:hypothetical protein